MSSTVVLAAAIAASVAFQLVTVPVLFTVAAAADSVEADPDSTLTLADARTRALARHPALASARPLVEAARARRTDAGRRPNPVLSAEVENFGNPAESSRLETTVQLGQTFELGGDRSARALVAEAALRVVEADLSAEQRAILTATAERFLDAWSLQERLSALRAAESLAVEAIAAARERHRAGAAPVTERVRAEAQHAMRRVERERAETELELARRLLAAQWGESEVTFTTLSPGEAGSDSTLPAAWVEAVEFHPQRRRAEAEILLQEARLREARAARVPDLDLQFGVRRLDETRTTGFVAGLALPLPLWNPQGGAVAAAQAEIVAARAREHAARLQLRNEVEGALGRIVIARATHDAVRTRIQPAAIEALAQVRSGYRAGRLSYTDLLDAQRAVRESDLALIEANVDLWRARIALDRLIGERAVVPSTEEESR